MEKTLIDTKIIHGNHAYIPIATGSKILGIPQDQIRSSCNVDTFTIGDSEIEAVSEAAFNTLLLSHPRKDVNMQFTKVSSLEMAAKELVGLVPLKLLIARPLLLEKANDLHLSLEEYLEQEYEENLEKEKEKIQHAQGLADKISAYQKQVENLSSVLIKAGLKDTVQIQTLTLLSDEYVDFLSFFAGDGFFYQCHPDDIPEDIQASEDGFSCYRPEMDDELFLTKKVLRDFRQHKAVDNIVFCLSHVESKNDFSDYLSVCLSDSIFLDLQIKIVLKLIRPENNPGEFWFEGIPHIEG